MVFETPLADLLVDAFIKPFYHCIFNLAHALQVCEVLLELVAIWRHTLQSIVVTDVLLFRKLLEETRFPFESVQVEHAHERHYGNRYLNVILGADRYHRDRVAAHVAGPVELTLFLV